MASSVAQSTRVIFVRLSAHIFFLSLSSCLDFHFGNLDCSMLPDPSLFIQTRQLIEYSFATPPGSTARHAAPLGTLFCQLADYKRCNFGIPQPSPFPSRLLKSLQPGYGCPSLQTTRPPSYGLLLPRIQFRPQPSTYLTMGIRPCLLTTFLFSHIAFFFSFSLFFFSFSLSLISPSLSSLSSFQSHTFVSTSPTHSLGNPNKIPIPRTLLLDLSLSNINKTTHTHNTHHPDL